MSSHENNDGNLWLTLVINILLTVVSVAGGVLSGSLTLFSAAADNFVDSFSVVIGLTASRIGRREPTEQKTYGYGRATLLGALLNSSIAIVLALILFYKSYMRIRHPEAVHGGTVLLIAVIGILLNGFAAFRLFQDRHDLNKRAIFIDMLFDSLASVGVLISGLLILITHKTVFDGIIAALLAVLFLYSAGRVLKEATHVLLDGVPAGVNIDDVEREVLSLESVERIDDLHIWGISSTKAAMSCHMVFNLESIEEISKEITHVKNLLNEKFAISHVTIEPELKNSHHGHDK